MKRPLFLLLATLLARPCLGAQGASGKIPTDPGPTAAGLANLTADSSFEGLRKHYDGGLRLDGDAEIAWREVPGPTTGEGKASANTRVPPVTAQKTVPAAKGADKKEFFDDATVGFAALGVLAGGVIGLGLIGALGMWGPLAGAAIGAVLLVGLFKWKGYKKDDKK